MKTVTISLNSIDKVKAFVNEITKYDYDFDLVSGRYVDWLLFFFCHFYIVLLFISLNMFSLCIAFFV